MIDKVEYIPYYAFKTKTLIGLASRTYQAMTWMLSGEGQKESRGKNTDDY